MEDHHGVRQRKLISSIDNNDSNEIVMRSGRTEANCLARRPRFPVPSLYYSESAILSRIRIFANLSSFVTCESNKYSVQLPSPAMTHYFEIVVDATTFQLQLSIRLLDRA